MSGLTKLERQVLRLLLDGDDKVLEILRRQLETCSVKSREFTGVGFMTTFKIQDPTEIVPGAKSFKFGDVCADIQGVVHGAGFLLYVKEGKIDALEAYTFDDPWPEEVGEFEISYVNGIRDLDEIRKNWLA